jgi:hypothetical protein
MLVVEEENFQKIDKEASEQQHEFNKLFTLSL